MKAVTIALAVIIATTVPLAADPPAEVKLQVVRYDALTEAVRKLRGRVVVVDFWADFCIPCKREFPHVVALARKHRNAGLEVISVSLDENTEASRDRVLTFLKKNNATFANYLLDNPPDYWQNKLKVDGPPLVFVFNRRGDLVRRFADREADHAAVEKLVTTLLTE
jgi:thiol-disulfide isomerase/thioredoxin